MAQVTEALAAFRRITKQRQALKSMERRLADREHELVADIGRALSDLGYRLMPLEEDKTTRRRAARKSVVRHDLQCPKCDRRFSFVMHVARHMSAMHRRGGRQRGTHTAKAA
jgi:hypothetical protein